MSESYAVRTLDCPVCGVSITGRFPKKKQTCSRTCGTVIAAKKRQTGKVTTCLQCDAESYRPAKRLKHLTFCGVECANAYQRRTKIKRSCKHCNCEFLVSPSRVKFDAANYCSLDCNYKASERLSHLIELNQKQQVQNGPNRLEQAGNKILDDLGIQYKTQVVIANKFTVDVLLDDGKTVIQWDGDYWHGFVPIDKVIDFDLRQRRRMALDKSQDAYMAKAGYRVIRFWEHDVHGSPTKVYEDIRRTIQQAA